MVFEGSAWIFGKRLELDSTVGFRNSVDESSESVEESRNSVEESGNYLEESRD